MYIMHSWMKSLQCRVSVVNVAITFVHNVSKLVMIWCTLCSCRVWACWLMILRHSRSCAVKC